jgi:tRNA/rRNA methyltransferase
VAELGEAVGDCVLAVATSARKGGLFRRQSVVPPEEAATRLVHALPAGPVALVFGPERSGLTDAEVTRCHYQVHVPSDPDYPALNLAQAVAICLYEVRRAWLRQSDTPVSLPELPAPLAEQERAFGHLKEALEAIHFLYGEKAEALMHGLRHLLGRAGPTAMELGLLHGLAKQIQWHVDHHGGS